LQKVIADAGFASRRAAEELIVAGRVSVDGAVQRVLGTRVNPETQRVAVDGVPLVTRRGRVYLALNKPRGTLSTMSDTRGRPCVGDLIRDFDTRLYHVGRLDADSEGLLLFTNDGELANLLMHPSHGVPKTYLAEVAGPVRRAAMRELVAGVDLDDGPARALSARPVGSVPGRTMIEIVLHEGRNHIVRRMLAAVGHPVLRLVRTKVATIALGELRPGRTRRLSPDEVRALYSSAMSTSPGAD
jgi:23S rRNA pseudouridine2605 synthase